MSLRFFILKGDPSKHELLESKVEDLGGIVMDKSFPSPSEVVFKLAMPLDLVDELELLASATLSELNELPLASTEIAVVIPSFSFHHSPHPACDVAEYLRRKGARTNIIGLARGVGRRTAQLSSYERALVEEHDAAVFILGSFKKCIVEKAPRLLEGLRARVVVAGGPKSIEEDLGHPYVGGIERRPLRYRADDLARLEAVSRAVEGLVAQERRLISLDPPLAPSVVVKELVERQLHVPSVPRLRGLRVKAPFRERALDVANVQLPQGLRLGDVATLAPSAIKGHVKVNLLPSSLLRSKGLVAQLVA